MATVSIIILGLALGSFVNALVWRVHEQSKKANKGKKDLSIMNGRSMCPNCKHQLSAKDLLPVLSWLSLKGKCRYCKKSISAQYPLVEACTALLFVISYIYWPQQFNNTQYVLFGLWLVMLTGLMALIIYDLKWFLLPNRIMYPLSFVAGAMALLSVATAFNTTQAIVSLLFGIAVGGGIFYALFQVSKGKWIGGGDVKLGWLLGSLVGSPSKSILFIFIAAFLGSLVSVPLMYTKRLKRNSVIPFGPFLIIGAIIAYLFGNDILRWYQHTFLLV